MWQGVATGTGREWTAMILRECTQHGKSTALFHKGSQTTRTSTHRDDLIQLGSRRSPGAEIVDTAYFGRRIPCRLRKAATLRSQLAGQTERFGAGSDIPDRSSIAFFVSSSSGSAGTSDRAAVDADKNRRSDNPGCPAICSGVEGGYRPPLHNCSSPF